MGLLGLDNPPPASTVPSSLASPAAPAKSPAAADADPTPAAATPLPTSPTGAANTPVSPQPAGGPVASTPAGGLRPGTTSTPLLPLGGVINSLLPSSSSLGSPLTLSVSPSGSLLPTASILTSSSKHPKSHSSSSAETSADSRLQSASSLPNPSASLSASSSLLNPSKAKDDSSNPLDDLAKPLVISAVALVSLISLLVTLGFLLRRCQRRDRRRARSRTLEMEGYNGAGKSPVIGDSPDMGEKTVDGEGGGKEGAFVQALGAKPRPAMSTAGAAPGKVGGGGDIYLGGGGYDASEISLGGPALSLANEGWGPGSGGGEYNPYPHSYGMGYGQQQQQNASLHRQNSMPYHPHAAHQLPPLAFGNNPYSAASPTFSSSSSQASPIPSSPQLLPSPLLAYINPLGSPPPSSSQQHQAQTPVEKTRPSDALVAGGLFSEEGVLMSVVRGFKPTMSDELEIDPFERVKLHQTYDDGWCMCSKESEERGVVPRDCLTVLSRTTSKTAAPSTRPINPSPSLTSLSSQSSSTAHLFPVPPSTAPSAKLDRLTQDHHRQQQQGGDENDLPPVPPYEIGGRPLSIITETSTLPGSSESGGMRLLADEEEGTARRPSVPRSHTSTSVRSARRSSLAANASAAGAWLDQRGQQR